AGHREPSGRCGLIFHAGLLSCLLSALAFRSAGCCDKGSRNATRMAKLTSTGPQVTKHLMNDTVEIAIASYPDVWRASVHGLTDMFAVADRYDRQTTQSRRLRVSHYEIDAASLVSKVFDTHPSEPEGKLVAVVLPPAIGEELPF